MPTWISEFSIAEKLRIPVTDVKHQPLRYLYRAQTLIEAEHEYQRMTRKG